MPLAESIQKKLRDLPHKPGIYLMRDRFGTVIYVGKARDLRKRVTQYFQPSRRMGWDLKFRALIEGIHDFDYHVVRSEPEALLLEGKLIKEFHPRYNVSFRDDKRFLLVKINLNDPIPRFTLTRIKQDDGARYFGPFPNAGSLRSTLSLVRRQYHLRGCRPLTPTERDYKHCLYAHLKYCTAPCIGNVTRDQYLDQIKAACDFLEGQCQEMQSQLENEMKKAAAAQEYEKAAQLRDLLSDLNRTTKKTNRFQRIPYSLPVAVEPERDLAELGKVLGLPAPPQRIEGIDISNISGTFVVASLVSFRNGRPDRANYRRFRIKTVEGQDDFASVAEVVRRRYTRLLKESEDPKGSPQQSPGLPINNPKGIASFSPGLRGTSYPGSASPETQSTLKGLRPPAPDEHQESTGEGQKVEARDESGQAVPSELQTLIDDVSAAKRGKRSRSPNTDSAAADVRAHRAPYSNPPSPIHGSASLSSTGGEGQGEEAGSGDEARDFETSNDSSGQSTNPSIHQSTNPSPRSNLPDLILIDGGRGQLNAACAELEKLGLSHIPILGLAKEFEEIYRPGEKEPLRLSEDSGALKLLQRVRDESHRLANTYNATLRLRKISESILDEFPNIGERRKAALLKKFGSIQRMRLATVEQLAEVPGFGGKAAAELKAFLEARST
jgi:excinuclease UvrABC nuclease subunit